MRINGGFNEMTKDLTKGKIMPLLITFTVPLVLGNLFQMTYNAVDSIIVGQFVGKEALAVVGICNPISTLMILFLNGLCMGASILMGIQYGAKNYESLERQISTTMISGVVFSFVITIICLLFARELMSLFVKDEEVIRHGVIYLHLIAVMYILPAFTNAIQGFFRGIGDLKVTLLSSFTNMGVRVIAALPMILVWNFGIEALPYSYLIGWIAMLLVETPLMIRIYKKK